MSSIWSGKLIWYLDIKMPVSASGSFSANCCFFSKRGCAVCYHRVLPMIFQVSSFSVSLHPHRVTVNTVDRGIVGCIVISWLCIVWNVTHLVSVVHWFWKVTPWNWEIKVVEFPSQWKGMSLARVCDLMGIIYPCWASVSSLRDLSLHIHSLLGLLGECI